MKIPGSFLVFFVSMVFGSAHQSIFCIKNGLAKASPEKNSQ